jgi:hypothetical protein
MALNGRVMQRLWMQGVALISNGNAEQGDGKE